MSASAGRVLIIPKGDYSASVTYGNLDMVYYGGKSYICKKTSLNNLPTDTEYWQLMVEGVAGSYYGTCSTAATTAEKAVTVSADQHFALFKGATITVKFTTTNTATNPTINVNGTGAASVVYGSGVITTGTLSYAGTANYSMTYVYDGTHWCWVSSGADANTTYSPQKLGIGYGTCSTAAATAEKAVTLSGYELITNGTIAVKFTNAVPASATLKVNSKTAKAIYYRGSAITANKIKAGDTAIFYYNGSQYHLICVDRPLDATDVAYSSGVSIKDAVDGKVSKSGDTMSGNLQVDLENGTTTQIGESIIRIGNNKASGTAKNSQGILRTYGAGQYYGDLLPDSLTANRSAKLPDKSGTLAMTSDVPAISAGAITKSSVVTAINSTVVKIGNLVIAQGAWYGGATNVQSIGQIAAGYRPSADLLCGGAVNYGGATYPCSYKIATNGTITQQQTGQSADSGCFFAAYVI